jgi:hypothetical protein
MSETLLNGGLEGSESCCYDADEHPAARRLLGCCNFTHQPSQG